MQVTTYGGGCIREDTTAVVVSGMRAAVVRYQQVYSPRPREACADILTITRRTETVRFPSAGRAMVRVIGRAAPGDSLVTIERAVAGQWRCVCSPTIRLCPHHRRSTWRTERIERGCGTGRASR